MRCFGSRLRASFARVSALVFLFALVILFALVMLPAVARAQVTFLPDPGDSYFRSSAGVDVSFFGQPGCGTEECNEFDTASSESDLFTLTPAMPASLADSVMNVGFPDFAMGSASSSGSVTIALDAGQLSGGTIDLAGSLNGTISHSHVDGESLRLQGIVDAPVAFSFLATGPAWIHLFGSISKSNPNPNQFSENSNVELRLTPGNPYATFDQAGGFDLGWIPLVVGEEALILADVELQLMAANEDCECVGLPLMIGSTVHVEFEIVPEPGSAVSPVAAIVVLGILRARRSRGLSRSTSSGVLQPRSSVRRRGSFSGIPSPSLTPARAPRPHR